MPPPLALLLCCFQVALLLVCGHDLQREASEQAISGESIFVKARFCPLADTRPWTDQVASFEGAVLCEAGLRLDQRPSPHPRDADRSSQLLALGFPASAREPVLPRHYPIRFRPAIVGVVVLLI